MSWRKVLIFLVVVLYGSKCKSQSNQGPLTNMTTNNSSTTDEITTSGMNTVSPALSDTASSESYFSTRKSSTETSVTGGNTNNTAYIAIGCVAGLVVFITLTLIIIFLILWKRKVSNVQESRMGLMNMNKTKNNSKNPVITPAKEIEEDVQRLTPIPIAEFSEVVKKKHFNANIAFEDEFESFPTKHESSYAVAKQKHNENKNRFDNIFPYDFSRVVLKEVKSDEVTNYINASFIDGYKRENAYIAAQGPLRNTIADYWRMIWEYEIKAIIMLTETIEAGRDKCAQYWPALMGTPWEVGNNVLVTLQSQTQYASYRMKTLLVENTEEPGEVPLIVTHFHYSAWPDHGVPADKTCLIQFIKRVRKDFPYYESPPLLVHCSAGVGRSGTFIVLDSMLERMTTEDSFNIYSFICEMRKKRALMVQTEAQYSFIHDALEEFITCGDTSIAVTNIRVVMVNLGKRDSSGKSGYAAQVELLDKVSYKQTAMNCNEAEKEYNVEKNRYKEHIPYNINRVCLRPGGSIRADYINASFINDMLALRPKKARALSVKLAMFTAFSRPP